MTYENPELGDLSEYEDQWVAIRKERIVASGSSYEEVEAAAPAKSVIGRVASSDPPAILEDLS